VGVSAVVNQPPPTGDLGTALESSLKVQTFACTVYRPASKQPAPLNTMLSAMKALGPIKTTLILAYMYDGVILAAAGAKAAGTTSDGSAIAQAVLKLKAGGPATAIFPAYHFTATSHSPNVVPSAFSFVPVTKVINGQFGAPGSK
jgi:branched-chain amino acid transport system substrate-binding protein